MIRANRNKERRAQRRPEHKHEEGEVVVEVKVADDQPAVEHQVEEENSNFGESLKSGPEVDREAKKVAERNVEEDNLRTQLEQTTQNSLCSSSEQRLASYSSGTEKEEESDSRSDISRKKSTNTEEREEVAGLVYVDYSQFDEDEEVGSVHDHDFGQHDLGQREEAYNLSQVRQPFDASPTGLTDEKVIFEKKNPIIYNTYPLTVQRCLRGIHREDQP